MGGERVPQFITCGCKGARVQRWMWTFDSITSSRAPPKQTATQRAEYAEYAEYGGYTCVLAVLFGFLAAAFLVREVVIYATAPVMPGSELCIDSATKSDATSQRMRSILGAEHGFQSCAVVGSAGFLRLQRLGAEIDTHEFVIRANLAPVSGFSPIVGSKTSLRVVNSEALGAILVEKSCSNSSTVRASMCASYPVYLNTGDWWMVSRYKKLCPNTTVFDNRDLDAWDPALHAQWQGLGTNLMSGAYAIAFALKVCPKGTTVYGVSHEATFELNNNASATYHYYDERKQSVYDSLPDSAVALTRLSETQPACLKLHAPANLFEKYQLPTPHSTHSTHASLADLFVDDIRHDLGRAAYLRHKNVCS